jgi:hypothetical protein
MPENKVTVVAKPTASDDPVTSTLTVPQKQFPE